MNHGWGSSWWCIRMHNGSKCRKKACSTFVAWGSGSKNGSPEIGVRSWKQKCHGTGRRESPEFPDHTVLHEISRRIQPWGSRGPQWPKINQKWQKSVTDTSLKNRVEVEKKKWHEMGRRGSPEFPDHTVLHEISRRIQPWGSDLPETLYLTSFEGSILPKFWPIFWWIFWGCGNKREMPI